MMTAIVYSSSHLFHWKTPDRWDKVDQQPRHSGTEGRKYVQIWVESPFEVQANVICFLHLLSEKRPWLD